MLDNCRWYLFWTIFRETTSSAGLSLLHHLIWPWKSSIHANNETLSFVTLEIQKYRGPGWHAGGFWCDDGAVMPWVTNFVWDAARVWNTHMVTVFYESHEHVAAQGSKNLQMCKWCRTHANLPENQTKWFWKPSVWIVTSNVMSRMVLRKLPKPQDWFPPCPSQQTTPIINTKEKT